MSTLRDTMFFVATPCGTSSESLPRSELVRRLTGRQMRWSQLIWCPNDQRWKPAREFPRLGGIQPIILQSPTPMAGDSTTGEASASTATLPQLAAVPISTPVLSTKRLTIPAPTPLRVKRVTTARVATPKTKVLGIPQTDEAIWGVKPMEGYLTVIVRVLKIPLVVMLTVFLTIYFMPLKVRAALADCASGQQVALWDAVESMIFKRVDAMVRSVTLQDGMGMTAVINLSRPMRIRGTLQLKTSTDKTIHLQVQGRCGTDGKTLLVDQVVEIPAGARSAAVFSVVAPKGTFYFTGTCQDGAPDQPVPATLVIATDY